MRRLAFALALVAMAGPAAASDASAEALVWLQKMSAASRQLVQFVSVWLRAP